MEPHTLFFILAAIAIPGYIVVKIINKQQNQSNIENEDAEIQPPVIRDIENFDTKDYVKQYVGRSK